MVRTVARERIPDGVVFTRRCLCKPCWAGRCLTCDQVVTTHDFTKEEAAAGIAEHKRREHAA